MLHCYISVWGFPVAQMVKNLPAMQETRVQSLSRENPLEKGMSTHSRFLAWRIPWTEEPCGLQSTGLQRVGHDWVANTHMYLLYYIYMYIHIYVIHYIALLYLFYIQWCVYIWEDWLALPTQSMDMSLSKTPAYGDRQGRPVCCSPWGSQRVAHNLVTEQ